ncbi:AsmA family protein [Nitrosomonas sp.]|uniref:AsmA family protein n=1 Tax=Nitrosomonas sp. TaxID=42353 RepID=UPI0020821356|nr:AsmA family protein [Nitrosomonas sp.]GJL76557.1 MAG: membrane protein [Nitrosomonas sp.]
MTIIKWIGIAFLSLVLLSVLSVSLMNWDWARDIAVQKVSDLTNRKLTIDGDLTVDWSLTPRIRIEQIQFENAAWSDQPNMLELAALELRIDLLKLIRGRVVFPEIMLTKPHIVLEKSSEGKPNWVFLTDEEPSSQDRTELPIIERLRIQDGRLIYRDLSAQTAITATLVTINEQTDKEATELEAKGKINGRPVQISLNAGPLIAIQHTETPYPLTLDLQAGKTTLNISGTITQPLQFKGLDLNFMITGPNPERLSQMLGLPLPSLPPYRLKGELSYLENALQLKALDGRIGNSDIAGKISLNMTEPIFIEADLTSKNIDLDDLGPLIGLAPDTGPGEKASVAQKKEAKKEAASPQVLPKESIDFERLRTINANIVLRSKHVESKLPVDDLIMKVIIDGGHLILAPLDFGVANGSIRSRFELDTRTQPVKSKIETEIRHVRLGEILHRFEMADKSAGLIGGQATFWFNGDSISEMFASADGGLLMLMTGGQFDDLLVELAGIDIGEALVALFGDKKNDAQINCAFVDLPTSNGVMDMDTLIIDTEDTVFLGKGSLDFNTEQLDLIIDPKPKDLSLFSARAPLHIGGSFNEPTFTPGKSAIIRGAASLALLPSAPIASLYSFLQEEMKDGKEGNQENIHCSDLVDAIHQARD